MVLKEVVPEGLAELMGDSDEHGVAFPARFAEQLLFLFVGEALFWRLGFAFLVLLVAVAFAPVVDEFLQLRADGGGIFKEALRCFKWVKGTGVAIEDGRL